MEKITFDAFKREWLHEILEGNPSTVEKGARFATKLFSQWQNIEDNTSFIYCDGCNDGGIDIAYQKAIQDEQGDTLGKTWYIVQSKYGTSYSGTGTLMTEATKIFNTIEGINTHLSETVQSLVFVLKLFFETAANEDKLVLVFATVDPLNELELASLNDVRAAGRERFGNRFDVDTISLATIYNRIQDIDVQETKNIIPIKANLVPSGEELLVGSIKLINIYEFMKDFKRKTQDLEVLYEKNVRQFLGSRKKVNKGIEKTIINEPERFGLYNNGITIVVEDYKQAESDVFELTNPYIVNGCQTTRTIWEILFKRLELIGSGTDIKHEEWKHKLHKGIVVVKIVKAGDNGHELLVNTTKYTNSQNSVGPKDFISLEQNFQGWSDEMRSKYGVYLEIQRGAWDCYKAMRRTNPTIQGCEECINAIDALKIYGAGWKKVPAIAFGKTPPFAPGGTIYKDIVNTEGFGVDGLYAAFLLKRLTDFKKYGKNTPVKHIGKARYVFYYIILDLLRSCMSFKNIHPSEENVTRCVIDVFSRLEGRAAYELYEAAHNVIDNWFNKGSEDSLYNEPMYHEDINAFLKADRLTARENTPNLAMLISDEQRALRRVRESICAEFSL